MQANHLAPGSVSGRGEGRPAREALWVERLQRAAGKVLRRQPRGRSEERWLVRAGDQAKWRAGELASLQSYSVQYPSWSDLRGAKPCGMANPWLSLARMDEQRRKTPPCRDAFGGMILYGNGGHREYSPNCYVYYLQYYCT